jgi:hypothetical protein
VKKAASVQAVHDRQRLLVMFHDGSADVNRHYHALAWMERVKGEVVALHLLYNDDGKVTHERRKPDEVQYLEAGMGKTTALQFEEYLRNKLVAHGGNAGAYEHLRVPKPVVEAVVSPEKKADLDELYTRAAGVLGVSEADLRKKYGPLNPGLQAMNLRNRLRHKGKAV